MNQSKQASNAAYRTVWITGASGSAGYSLARQLAKARNYVFVSARSESRLASLAEAYPENICAIPLDVADEDGLIQAFQRLKEHTDHLDTLVVAAEQFEFSDEKGESDRADRLMRVNYQGAVKTMHLALPLLKRSRNSPHIIVVGSLLTQLPLPQASAFAASKRALEYYAQSLAIEIGKGGVGVSGVGVSIVRPWFIDRKNLQRKRPFVAGSVKPELLAKQILIAMQARPEQVSFPFRYTLLTRALRAMPQLFLRGYVQKFQNPNTI